MEGRGRSEGDGGLEPARLIRKDVVRGLGKLSPSSRPSVTGSCHPG